MRHLVAGLAIVMASGLAPARVTAQAAEATAEMQRHFDLGNSLYHEARYADALVEYDKAYALSNNWKILFNRGQCLVMLRRDPEAIASFERYLGEGGDEIPQARREEVERDLAQLRLRLARLTLIDPPPGLDVVIDGNKVGTTPLKEPLVVGAGKHELSLRRGGTPVFVRDVAIAAGESSSIAIDLPPEKEQTPPPAATLPATEGLVHPAFNLGLTFGIVTPTRNLLQGQFLSPIGALELAASWRFHRLWSGGMFFGGAFGEFELRDDKATAAGVEQDTRYSYAMGGVHARLHFLRDRRIDGWLGAKVGVWREHWQFAGIGGAQGFGYVATSPVFGFGGGLDFPLARTWALGGAAHLFGTDAGQGNRVNCGARCDGGLPSGGGGGGIRAFFEVAIRVTFSIPYGA